MEQFTFILNYVFKLIYSAQNLVPVPVKFVIEPDGQVKRLQHKAINALFKELYQDQSIFRI